MGKIKRDKKQISDLPLGVKRSIPRLNAELRALPFLRRISIRERVHHLWDRFRITAAHASVLSDPIV